MGAPLRRRPGCHWTNDSAERSAVRDRRRPGEVVFAAARGDADVERRRKRRRCPAAAPRGRRCHAPRPRGLQHRGQAEAGCDARGRARRDGHDHGAIASRASGSVSAERRPDVRYRAAPGAGRRRRQADHRRADGVGGIRAAHRVRECGESAACARAGASKGIFRARSARGGPGSPGRSGRRREPAAGRRRWRPRRRARCARPCVHPAAGLAERAAPGGSRHQRGSARVHARRVGCVGRPLRSRSGLADRWPGRQRGTEGCRARRVGRGRRLGTGPRRPTSARRPRTGAERRPARRCGTLDSKLCRAAASLAGVRLASGAHLRTGVERPAVSGRRRDGRFAPSDAGTTRRVFRASPRLVPYRHCR